MSEWVRPPFDSSGKIVASYVTARFDAYARVLNPVCGPGNERRPWSDFLPPGTVALSSEIQWSDFGIEQSQQREPETGTVDENMLSALLDELAEDDRALVILAQWEGYADADLPSGARLAILPPDRRTGIWTASVADLKALERSPMRFWDPQGRWAVGNDIYGRSVFVGADSGRIEKLLSNPDIEAVRVAPADPVTPEDR